MVILGNKAIVGSVLHKFTIINIYLIINVMSFNC